MLILDLITLLLDAFRTLFSPTPLEDTNLFQPIRIGDVTLKNRLVHAPASRYQATADHVATDSMLTYYAQRAENNGGLLVFEGTYLSEKYGAKLNAPAIETDRQVEALGKIAQAVHEEGSAISLQLTIGWKAAENHVNTMSKAEIRSLVKEYAKAAKKAISQAKFDFVEIQTGYMTLPEQFLVPYFNQRSDRYGGPIENRARFILDTVDAIVKAVGAQHTALRISPYGIGDNTAANPYAYVLEQLENRAKKGNRIAYLSVVEPGSPTWVNQLWKGALIRTCHMVDPNKYKRLRSFVEDNDRTLVGSASYFSSNPDLVQRLRKGFPLTKYDEKSLYFTHGNNGYINWGRYGEKMVRDDRKPQPLA